MFYVIIFLIKKLYIIFYHYLLIYGWFFVNESAKKYLNLYEENRFLKNEIELLRSEYIRERDNNIQLQQYINILIYKKK